MGLALEERPADSSGPGASALAALLRAGRSAPRAYTQPMTRMLNAAMARLAALAPEEQDRVARWLLDELADDEHWSRQFDSSQDALSKLAAEARDDHAAGRTTDLNLERP